jgi:phospho-N-acetylmuramoyl-pentapeptide-transferase
MVILAGFLTSTVVGWILLKVFGRLNVRQTVYEDAPQTHQKKSGTLTMGGFAILAAMAILLPETTNNALEMLLLMLVFGCALVGFIDDFLGIRYGKNRGLRARTKFLATALLATVFLPRAHDWWPWAVMGQRPTVTTTIFHAGNYWLTVPYWLWLLLGIIAITATIHAVNLTDGLDGLAAGTIIPPLIVFVWIALQMSTMSADHWPVIPTLAIGGCLGFLLYNGHPAKLIMGDTGSLALGALLAGSAILTGEMLLLVLVGAVFVAEALSVILQVAYFKLTHGKRIFKMSPLHHHFELSGWPETKVTTRFWIASAICSAVGLAIVR